MNILDEKIKASSHIKPPTTKKISKEEVKYLSRSLLIGGVLPPHLRKVYFSNKCCKSTRSRICDLQTASDSIALQNACTNIPDPETECMQVDTRQLWYMSNLLLFISLWCHPYFTRIRALLLIQSCCVDSLVINGVANFI